MKKTTQQKSSFNASFALALLFCLIALTALPATSQAQTFVKSNTPGIVVNYLGVENDQFGFAVKFKNEKGEKFTLTVKDADGGTVYSERFNAKNLLKKFLFSKEAFSDAKLTFVITTAANVQIQAVAININTRVTEDVVVTKN